MGLLAILGIVAIVGGAVLIFVQNALILGLVVILLGVLLLAVGGGYHTRL